jgi:2-aminoethylphosphonate-pyruvate transaminase
MKDPLLFTPGPLTTSATVKAAMQRDIGSRDADFIELVAGIRSELLRIAGVSRKQGYEAVLMQGSGTFGLESVISSVIPPEGRFVVLANGVYGERMAAIAERLGISTRLARWPENESPQPQAVRRLIKEEPAATHVAMVHCETTTGILNPIDEIGLFLRAGATRGAGSDQRPCAQRQSRSARTMGRS